MRFMMLMIPKGYEQAAPDAVPSKEAGDAVMKYKAELSKAGMLRALDGLPPPAVGARISFKQGKATATDGPFTEAKEVLGGYWMIQAKSKAEAVAWALKCPANDGDIIEV